MALLEIKKNLVAESAKKAKPVGRDIGFGKIFTDHMFMMDYDEGKGWHSAQILPYGPLELDPAAMILHYGQAVFEGMKAYRSPEGKILLFRPTENFKRLNISDDRMCIPHIDEDFALHALTELLKVEADWVPSAPDTSLYIRPFVFASQPAVGVHPAKSYKFLIILTPVGPYFSTGLAPVNILVEDEYVRAVKGGIGAAKAAANYAASLKAQQKAMDKGYAQVLWLDGIERKYVEEVGAMNMFFLINGELVTPELNGSILPGITRASIIQLARSWGMTVTERRLAIDEIFKAAEDGSLTEVFGCGTAAVIAPIKEFLMGEKSVQVADGNTGPFAQKLYENLTGIQFGKIPDPFGWSYEVKM